MTPVSILATALQDEVTRRGLGWPSSTTLTKRGVTLETGAHMLDCNIVHFVASLAWGSSKKCASPASSYVRVHHTRKTNILPIPIPFRTTVSALATAVVVMSAATVVGTGFTCPLILEATIWVVEPPPTAKLATASTVGRAVLNHRLEAGLPEGHERPQFLDGSIGETLL